MGAVTSDTMVLSRRSWRDGLTSAQVQGWIFLAPALIIYAGFALYPMIEVFVLSFQKWNGLTPAREFVGFANYIFIFRDDPVFWMAFGNTAIWTALAIVIPPVAGFFLALALNQALPARNALRAIFYLPVVIAPIAVATMWKWMYDPFFGLFSTFLTDLGLQALIPDWLGDRKIALYSIFAAYVWQHAGFSMVLFLAGLQGVSDSLIEAARMDGASRSQVLRYVILPALRTTTTVVIVLSLIQSLRAFDVVYGMTGGGPAQSTQMLALWAFTQSMQIHDFGRGAAVAVVLLLMTIAVIVPYLLWRARIDKAQGRTA